MLATKKTGGRDGWTAAMKVVLKGKHKCEDKICESEEIGVVVTTKSGVCQGWASAVLLQYSNNVMWIRARFRWWTRKRH